MICVITQIHWELSMIVDKEEESLSSCLPYHRMWLITCFLTCAKVRFSDVSFIHGSSSPGFCGVHIQSALFYTVYSVSLFIFCPVYLSCVYYTVFSGLMIDTPATMILHLFVYWISQTFVIVAKKFILQTVTLLTMQ